MTLQTSNYLPLQALSNLLNMHFDGKLCNKEIRRFACSLHACTFGQTNNDTKRLRSFVSKDKQKFFRIWDD